MLLEAPGEVLYSHSNQRDRRDLRLPPPTVQGSPGTPQQRSLLALRSHVVPLPALRSSGLLAKGAAVLASKVLVPARRLQGLQRRVLALLIHPLRHRVARALSRTHVVWLAMVPVLRLPLQRPVNRLKHRLRHRKRRICRIPAPLSQRGTRAGLHPSMLSMLRRKRLRRKRKRLVRKRKNMRNFTHKCKLSKCKLSKCELRPERQCRLKRRFPRQWFQRQV